MKPKFLGILIACAAVVAILAYMVSRPTPSASTTAADSAELIPGFADKINSVARIEMRKGKETIVAALQGGTDKDTAKSGKWVLESRSNFPAKFDKVKETLVSFNETKLLEKKTDQPDRFAALEIEDPSDTSKSTLITLTDANKQPIASFIVGKMAQGPGGRSGDGFYIRKAGEKQVWQSSLKTAPDFTFSMWVDSIVLQLERARIRSAAIVPAAGDKITVSKAKPEDPGFTLENMPAGKVLKSPNAADAPVYAIEYLDMTDVVPASSIDFTKEPISTATYTTFDGLVVTATIAKANDKNWFKLSFATDFTNVPGEKKDEAKKDEPKKDPSAPEPAKPKSRDEVTKEAADLNAKHAPWAYQLVDYKVNQFNPKLADMIQDPAPPPAQAPGSAPPAGGVPFIQNPPSAPK